MGFDINGIKNNIKSNIEKATEFTVKYTGKAVSYTKLKVKATDAKAKISDLYKKIGEAVYSGIKNDEDVQGKIETLVADIDKLREKIDECNEELESLK